MRRAAIGGQAHLLRELEQLLQQGSGRGVYRIARREIGVRGFGDSVGACLPEDRRDPGVRVLHVVDGVLLRLLPGELEIQVERGVVRALQHEEARGVDADVVQQVVERDELAAPLRELRPLPVLEQVHELHDHELELARLATERLPRDLHPRHVAVVVGAPHVDHAVEAALALVLVVGDVGGEVGLLAGRALQHAVLVVAQRCRAEPDRPFAVVDVPVLAQQLDRALDRAVLVQVALVEEAVEGDPVALERRAHLLDHQLDAARGELVHVGLGRAFDLGGEFDHVLALVAVLGSVLTAGTRLDRLAEPAHLRPVVVHVVLALHLVAGEVQDPRERVPVRGVPSGGRVGGTGRVRTHELDLDPLGLGRVAAAVVVARGGGGGERAAEPGIRHEQVEEPRPGDLDAREIVAEPLGHQRAELLRNGAGRLAKQRGASSIGALLE